MSAVCCSLFLRGLVFALRRQCWDHPPCGRPLSPIPPPRPEGHCSQAMLQGVLVLRHDSGKVAAMAEVGAPGARRSPYYLPIRLNFFYAD